MIKVYRRNKVTKGSDIMGNRESMCSNMCNCSEEEISVIHDLCNMFQLDLKATHVLVEGWVEVEADYTLNRHKYKTHRFQLISDDRVLDADAIKDLKENYTEVKLNDSVKS